MTLHRNEVMNIATQAADWLRIIQARDPQQEAAFLKWLKESPLHVRETLLAYKVDQQLRRMDPNRQIDIERLFREVSTNVFPMDAARASTLAPRARRPARWIAAAAACLIAVLAAWLLQYAASSGEDSFATSTGEQRNFALDDGSVVYLNTQSRLRVRFDEASREIYLDDGQAMFEVQRDPVRPFRVHAGTAVIQAIGTEFDVRKFPDRVTVAVVEGAVKLLSDDRGQPAMLADKSIRAGESATVTEQGGASPIMQIDASAATAWRQQQLVFENTPLAQIVSEFNRYNRSPRLRVEDAQVGALKFNGVFNARSPESLLAYLEIHAPLEFERHGDEVVLRGR